MKQPKVISVCAAKGGVGKTTTTVALSENLASLGKQVLVIDADYQTSTTVALIGNDHWEELNDDNKTIVALLEDAISEGKEDYHRQFDPDTRIFEGASNLNEVLEGNIDLLPSSPKLVKTKKNIYKAGRESSYGAVNRLNFLDWGLREKLSEYDYVLIDTHPDLDDMLFASLHLSDYYLVPVIPDAISTYGVVTMNKAVAEFSRENRRNVKQAGVLISMYRQIKAHNKYVNVLEERDDVNLFKTRIPLRAHMTEFLDYDHPYTTFKAKYGYDREDIAKDYADLTQEVIDRCQ